MLLERQSIPALDAVERLACLQAQVPSPPYVGLWTRLRDFRREELSRLMEERLVVRATLMRATLHLMTAEDYLLLRPALQPALTRSMNSIARMRLEGVDLDRLVGVAREYFEDRAAPLRRLSSPARRARTGQGPIGPRLCGEDPASARTGAFGWRVGLLWESALHYRREVAGQRALGFRRSARARAQVSRGVRTSDGEGRPDMVWQDKTEAGSRGDQAGVAGLPGRE